MKGKKTLEINPRHPLVKELKAKADSAPDDELYKRLGVLMYESALVESGFSLEDTKGFTSRLSALVRDTLGVDEAATVDEEPAEGSEDAEPVEEEEEPEPAPGSIPPPPTRRGAAHDDL